jgi:predicted metal-dependent hydrolase
MSKLGIQIQKEINLHGKNIIYIHRVSIKAKVMRLAIYHDGSFVVTTPKRFSENMIFDFIMKKSTWIVEKIQYFKDNPRRIVVKHTIKEIVEYKKQANVLARLRLEHFNSLYHFRYNKITIKNITSRWGSCSSKGNLNFNYKIATLSQELSDYIIVHELCHLREMNHSKNFWNLVEQTIPNYKALRKQLRLLV